MLNPFTHVLLFIHSQLVFSFYFLKINKICQQELVDGGKNQKQKQNSYTLRNVTPSLQCHKK